VIRTLLPAGVSFAEATPADWAAPLHPVEARAVAGADKARRREFQAGRSCARRALAQLGVSGTIPVGPGREPRWPGGVVGAITHTAGYCAAAVARATEVRAVGIDAERNQPLEDGLLPVICTAHERRCMPADQGVSWPVVLLSAKESLFKVWYPLTGLWLGFHQAVLDVDLEGGAFVARLLVAPPPDAAFLTEVEGRIAVTSSHVYTAITI
jgi:4'-phosphopantetheinyl transferase EntD